MATHPSILAWRIHGQRSLLGYSPWGHKGWDITKRLIHTQMKWTIPSHHRLPKLTQEETEDLKRPIINNRGWTSNQKTTHKEKPGSRWPLVVNFTP